MTGNLLEGAVDGLLVKFDTFDLLQGCNSQEVAVTRQEMRTHYGSDREVMSFDWMSPGSRSGRPISFWVRLDSHRAVAHRRLKSCDRKRCHVTLRDWM